MSVGAEMRRSMIGWGIGVTLFVVAALLLVWLPGIEVVSRQPGEPELLRIGSFTFLGAPHENAFTDHLNALVLVWLAAAALVMSLLYRRLAGVSGTRVRSFYRAVAIAAALLALDEQFDLTETLAYNLGFLESIPEAQKKDFDAFVYPLPALAFFWYYRDVVLSSKAALPLWVLGGGLFFVGLAVDAGFDSRREDALEIAASAVFLAAFITLGFDRVLTAFEALESRVGRAAPPPQRSVVRS